MGGVGKCDVGPVGGIELQTGYDIGTKSAANSVEIAPIGLGCFHLPLIGGFRLTPVMSMSLELPSTGGAKPGVGVGIGMVSFSHALRFLHIDTLEMTRAVMATERGVKLSQAYMLPLDKHVAFGLSYANEFHLYSGSLKSDTTIGLGARYTF